MANYVDFHEVTKWSDNCDWKQLTHNPNVMDWVQNKIEDPPMSWPMLAYYTGMITLNAVLFIAHCKIGGYPLL